MESLPHPPPMALTSPPPMALTSPFPSHTQPRGPCLPRGPCPPVLHPRPGSCGATQACGKTGHSDLSLGLSLRRKLHMVRKCLDHDGTRGSSSHKCTAFLSVSSNSALSAPLASRLFHDAAWDLKTSQPASSSAQANATCQVYHSTTSPLPRGPRRALCLTPSPAATSQLSPLLLVLVLLILLCLPDTLVLGASTAAQHSTAQHSMTQHSRAGLTDTD